MDQGNDGGVFDASDAAAFDIKDRHRDEFCKVQKLFRHRIRPSAGHEERTKERTSSLVLICALHRFTTPFPIWRIANWSRNKKSGGINGFAVATGSWSSFSW